MLAILAGGPAAAQPPGQPFPGVPGRYNTPFPTTVPYQPGAPARWPAQAQPAAAAQPPAQPRAEAPAAPAGGPPAGYHAVGGGQTPAAARTGPVGSGGGKVMYFHKAADALVSDAPPDAGGVALAAAADVPSVAAGVPDVPAPALGGLPRPSRATVADRPIPPPAAAFVAQPTPGAQPPAPPVADQPSPEARRLPPPDQIFRLYGDATLEREIIASVARQIDQAPESLTFPKLPPVVPPGTPYVSKTGSYPPSRAVAEPAFVVHRRLHFEEKNAERAGWDLGFIQPVVSTAYFYKDVLLWPNSLASGLEVGFWDTSAGKCLPGSRTPYYLYPPGLTVTGMMVEAGVITGGAFILHPVGAGNLPGPFIH